jgi:hypothetical protein
MPVICPKCSHVRPADATNPEWQCPACGICYAKFGSQPVAQARPARYVGSASAPRWNPGWLFKIVLLIALGWGLYVTVERRLKPAADDQLVVTEQRQEQQEQQEQQERQEHGAGVALADAVLRVSEADASMLHRLSGRLEKACARNQYGLSEGACVARLREREDGCAAKTAQQFPGQIGDTSRMQLISRAYVGCIFEGREGR